MTPIAKILVVDDDRGIRFFLEELLMNDGHQVVTVDSGEAALARIAHEEFDLALIDLKMPGISGTEVLAALSQKWPDTVVIMLTGYGSLESAVEALRHGAHDYLFKPCKAAEIRESIRVGLLNRQRQARQRKLLRQLEHSLSSSLAEVRATMDGVPNVSVSDTPDRRQISVQEPEQAEPSQGQLVRCGPVEVDLMRHTVTLDEQAVELSPTEFDLLVHLMQQSPRVVPPQELLQAAQGYEGETWEARDIIRYHIYRLRRKLKAVSSAADDFIETVRGVGYTVKP